MLKEIFKQIKERTTFQMFNCSTIQRVKAYAFTLAEVLIVIGIIGVVAALTLPNLNHATGDKEKITRLKKAYSVLSESLDRAQAIYGDFDTWFKDLEDQEDVEARSERFSNRISEILKVSRACDYEDDSCFSYSGSGEGQYTDGYSVIMPDGTALLFNVSDFGQDDFTNTIIVDIDGPKKGKNQDGNDVFAFLVYDNILHPGNIGNGGYIFSESELLGNCIGQNYCTGWVLEFDNMDYLKADSSGKCNDSNIILDGVTNTSCH